MVSRVTEKGIVVIVPEFGLESKVRLETMQDGAVAFKFDEKTLTLQEVKSGTTVRIFDQVKVYIDVETGKGRRDKLVIKLLEPAFGQKRPTLDNSPTARNAKKQKL